VDIDDTYTDIAALIIPAFATTGLVTILSSAGEQWSWRTNGQTGATGHFFPYAGGGEYSNCIVLTDSSQIIEIKKAAAGAETITVYTGGWKFPIGM